MKIDGFIDARMGHEPQNAAFTRFLKLVKQQFDTQTIVVAMLYAERLRDSRIFAKEEELGLVCFILADYFINDQLITRSFLEQNGFSMQGVDDLICQVLTLFADSLAVSREDFLCMKEQLDNLDYN